MLRKPTILRMNLVVALTLLAGTVGCSVDGGGRGSFGAGASVGDTETATDSDGSGSAGTTTGAEDPNGTPTGSANEAEQYIEDARLNFVTYRDIHEDVISRTCTPNSNVCHNNKEYPDLRTPQGVIDRIGRPCNLNELYTDPATVFNGCEPRGDTLRFSDGGNLGHVVEIGWVDVNDDGKGGGNVVVHIKEPMPQNMASGTFESIVIERLVGEQTQSVGSINAAVSYALGGKAIQINATASFAEHVSLLESEVVPGDPNRDEVYGASDDQAMQEIAPGDPWNSYLLQRLQGNVPGSPMPLANEPLTAAEVVAIACWIEGTAAPGGAETESVIDYDQCQYAAELTAPPDGAGATMAMVQDILDQSCAFGGCHGAMNAAAGLDLSDGKARASLLGVLATQAPSIPFVTALNPTNSYLITKLLGAGNSGQRMPLGAQPLTDSQVDIIRTWIIQGAPDYE